MKLSKDGHDDVLLDYIYENYDEIECVLNGEEYKEPKRYNHNFCTDCLVEKIIDYQKLTFVCWKCGSSEYYPAYVT